jgi:phospholipid N-methyltransferase
MFYLNLNQLSVLKNVFTLPIKQVLNNGNIVGAILDMSIGISKDIIVTVGADKHIRVFEYGGGKPLSDAIASGPSQGSALTHTLNIG